MDINNKVEHEHREASIKEMLKMEVNNKNKFIGVEKGRKINAKNDLVIIHKDTTEQGKQ